MCDKTTMYFDPLIGLERGQVAHDWNGVHDAQVVVNGQVHVTM